MFEYDTIHFNNCIVYIIRYKPYCLEDYFHILHSSESDRLNQFSSIKRKSEFLSTRILKETIFPGKLIQYTEGGIPYIEGVPYISISHCSGCSAIAVCNEHIIGLDIEPIGGKAQRLHERFLNEYEKSFLDTENDLAMTRSWSCKEALLKLSERKGILFKQDLLLNEYDGDELFTCSILKENKRFSVNLTSRVLNETILTINHTDLIENEFA